MSLLIIEVSVISKGLSLCHVKGSLRLSVNGKRKESDFCENKLADNKHAKTAVSILPIQELRVNFQQLWLSKSVFNMLINFSV